MINRINKLLKEYLFIQIPNKNRSEFNTIVNSINLSRGKVTAVAFIVLEIIQFSIYFILLGNEFFNKPHIYYAIMYVLMIVAMVLFLNLFIKISKSVESYETEITIIGIFFASFILFWCIGISLLDQSVNGEIIVYTVALMAVAVAPVFEPIYIMIIYIVVHVFFIAALPNFQKSNAVLYSHYINSTGFLLISWAISYMRYKSQIREFYNKKTIERNSQELKRLNSELQEANMKLEKLSHTDGLTGISNRFLFDKTLKAEWNRCKRYLVPLSLIMVDIDFFKYYNDSYGHLKGDECLKEIAKVLSSNVRRSSDLVARYGGEEFAIILPYMSRDEAMDFAEQLRRDVEALAIPHMSSSISKVVTISLGVHTVIPNEDFSTEKLIIHADNALYKAKVERNKVAYA